MSKKKSRKMPLPAKIDNSYEAQFCRWCAAAWEWVCTEGNEAALQPNLSRLFQSIVTRTAREQNKTQEEAIEHVFDTVIAMMSRRIEIDGDCPDGLTVNEIGEFMMIKLVAALPECGLMPVVSPDCGYELVDPKSLMN